MTQLELLAAKIRGADSNADAAAIIEKWFTEQTHHAKKLARESADILTADAAKFKDSPYETLLNQLARNFSSVETILELSNKELE